MNIIKRIYCNFSSRSRLIRQLEDRQKTADTQDEWMNLAEQIDNIQGNDVWRSEQSCALYESDRISSRVDELVHLMRRRDVFDLMFTLRGGIARNKFGLLHEGLFSKALAGSKVLVETYHNVVCKALEFVCEAPTLPGEDPIPTEARLAFFNETRHSYGRSALMLSGGAALGFYHVGVVKALMENGLLPRVISGASAGSIVCAMAGTRTDEECKRDLFMAKGTVAPGHSGAIMTDFFRPIQSRRDVESSKKKPHESDLKEVLHNTAGAFSDAKKTFQLFVPIGVRNVTSSLFDVFTGHKRAKDVLKSDLDHFRLCCQTNIGNFTFQEAFDRTGRILNIIVSPQNRSDPPRLLNYLTAPHVLVWSAAVASSSLPGVFEANRLLVKDADGTERYESANVASFIDGSMEQDLPMQQLAEIFNINHFIISQVCRTNDFQLSFQ
jgi:TAG lipase/steryl ester hydrolase/phospholipase A2/LPA acyltransferase